MDLTHEKKIDYLVNTVKPDYIINLAGIFGAELLDDLVRVNTGISQKLLEKIIQYRHSIKNVLFIGSAAEYGNSTCFPIHEDHPLNPCNFYGLSKVFQTQIARYYFNTFEININIVRPFNIIGTGLSRKLALGAFIEQIKNLPSGGVIQVGNIHTRRDYIAVEDVVDAYWKILLHGKPGEIYNLCQGMSFPINDLLQEAIKISGKNLSVRINSDLIRKNDILDSYGDNSKLKSTVPWKVQYNIENSIRNMLK
jgi:GDP-4-dehydro-6-deoxy-D-mannose reductase